MDIKNVNNIDEKTVSSFGDEWKRFDQKGMSDEESKKIFNNYFSIFQWNNISSDAEGFDMGCGSGRWARFVAPRVGHLNCIDPSDAIDVAKKTLCDFNNITFIRGSVSDSHLKKNSQDFGYSLGVLHHVPDTAAAIRSCVDLLKPGAPLLLYLYYAFDNRPWWFRTIWRVSDLARQIIYRLPPSLKHIITDVIALLVYVPLTALSRLMERVGFNVASLPLSYYRKYSFYTMRTDARDRFGTPLERRFSRHQITEMMKKAGRVDVQFSDVEPHWCVVGSKGK